jgi:hypothetical protein
LKKKNNSGKLELHGARNPQSKFRRLVKGLSRNVVILGFVSLLNDGASK